MRGAILILVLLIIILLGNIITYSVSEDYRFFVKKIKYPQELVYENQNQVDDSQRIILYEDTPNESISDTDIVTISQEGFTFLDALGIKSPEIKKDEILPELTLVEQEVLDKMREKFVLSENISSASLFDITTEYPDQYHEYANKHLSLYIFPTKKYTEIYNIFDVLRYDLPYTLNKTNNFGEKSFYINLEGAYSDDKVRIVLQYQNKSFGLKIKKDSYNTVKQIFEQLNVN